VTTGRLVDDVDEAPRDLPQVGPRHQSAHGISGGEGQEGEST
jgi:hypothetical protein